MRVWPFPKAIIAGLIVLLASSIAVAAGTKQFDVSTLGADAHAWNAASSLLVYAMRDGSIWSRSAPNFASPFLITKLELPTEQRVEQIVWSPEGDQFAIISPRSPDLWDTIWLVDPNKSEVRDLLPPGAPFGGPGIRALRISTWLADGRILFGVHCGTGCVGLHGVQSKNRGTYWDFCDSSGDFFWSPANDVAVVENDREHIGPASLGLVSISDGVEVPKGASYYRPRKECPSIFEGEQPCGTCGSSQAGPHFDSWFPDNRTVLYTEAGLNSSKLKLWDTKTGARRTLAASGASGMISADGRYVCFVAPEGEKTITSRSKRVLFQVLDLQSRKVILSKEVPAHTSFQCSPPQ